MRTPYSGRGIDLVIVRENVEDLYAGIEHMQTPGVAQCLKLISRKGSEKIIRLAFEVALAEGRKRVHCATKANIMKLTEGMMKRTFEAVAKEYPQIEAQHIIVDNCAHQLVKKPEQFDVIVTTNMNGDILSDLTSALIGGLGFAPSANIGAEVGDLRGGPRLGAEVRGQERDQPDRHDPLRRAHAPPHRRDVRRRGRGAGRPCRPGGRGAHPRRRGRRGSRLHDRVHRSGDRTAGQEAEAGEGAGVPAAETAVGLLRPRLREGRRSAALWAWTCSSSPRCPWNSWARASSEIVAGSPVELKMVDSRGHQDLPLHGDDHRHRGPLSAAGSCSAHRRAT